MPLPRSVARFNKLVTNHVTVHFAGRLPGFAIVVHQGRRSGAGYRTPVNVFRRGDRYLFALTYGRDSDWVKNVLAAGACAIETRGRQVSLANPELIEDPRRQAVSPPARWILGLLRVDEFLSMTAAA